jgi:hypothetical protein
MTPIYTPNQPKKLKVSQADKEKEARTVRHVFTDHPYRSQNLADDSGCLDNNLGPFVGGP